MNIHFGGSFFGRLLYTGRADKSGKKNDGKGTVRDYYPNQFTVITYVENGTKTAFLGSGIENNTLSKVTFEISSTGCGSCELIFKVLPTNSELSYMQRIDIFLFGDELPWYSGYIITRPIEGTTETEFKFTAHGISDWNTGTLLFNSADAGKAITVSYNGTGTLVDDRLQDMLELSITSSTQRERNAVFSSASTDSYDKTEMQGSGNMRAGYVRLCQHTEFPAEKYTLREVLQQLINRSQTFEFISGMRKYNCNCDCGDDSH